MAFNPQTPLPLTTDVLHTVVDKYRARLKRHVNVPTYLTQVEDLELDALLRLTESILHQVEKLPLDTTPPGEDNS